MWQRNFISFGHNCWSFFCSCYMVQKFWFERVMETFTVAKKIIEA